MGSLNSENSGVFVDAYRKAIDNNDEVFWFEGQQILTSYAGYVIEYLTNLGVCV